MNRPTETTSQLADALVDADRMMIAAFASLPLLGLKKAHGADYRSRFAARRMEQAHSRVDHRDEMLRNRRLRSGSLYLYRDEAELPRAVNGASGRLRPQPHT